MALPEYQRIDCIFQWNMKELQLDYSMPHSTFAHVDCVFILFPKISKIQLCVQKNQNVRMKSQI